jgi:hypothetical protein
MGGSGFTRADQTDLVEVFFRFDPKISKVCSAGEGGQSANSVG